VRNVAIIFAMLISTTPAKADWKEVASNYFFFAAGIATSFIVHEAAHELTARAYGERLDWQDGKWICNYPCPDLDKIALAGNLSTAILGESLLYLPDKYRNTPYVDGMQTFNTVNPIAYAYKDSTTSEGYGDYRHVDDRIQIALAIHAASIGYRQFSDRLWNVAVVPRGIKFNIQF
jgi:hypothetical protein